MAVGALLAVGSFARPPDPAPCTGFLPGDRLPAIRTKDARQAVLVCHGGYMALVSRRTRDPVWSAEHLTRSGLLAAARLRWRRLTDAAAFAMTIHADQVRKGANTPYLGHLLGVASLVLENGGDEDQARAGLLHDAVEDQVAHQEPMIRERFGGRVADIVLGCTDADTLPSRHGASARSATSAI